MSQVDAAGSKQRSEPIQGDAQQGGVQGENRDALRSAASDKAQGIDKVSEKAVADAGLPQDQFAHHTGKKVPIPQQKPGLRDGDFLNDPTKMDRHQARHLEQLSKDPNTPDWAKKHIDSFLKDYRAGKDSLFPKGDADFTKEQWQRFRDATRNSPFNTEL